LGIGDWGLGIEQIGDNNYRNARIKKLKISAH
jgi:hypothetical protein